MIKNMGIPNVEAACETEPRNRSHGRSTHSYAKQAKKDFKLYSDVVTQHIAGRENNAHKVR